MTKPPHSTRHIDQNKIRKREGVKERLRLALECGDEEGYIQLLKDLKPDLKPEELVARVAEFREIRKIRSRGA